MSEPFKLRIVSFDTIIVNEPARYCSVYTRTGKMGFKARHEPFVSVLKDGSEIRYTTDDGREDGVTVRNGLVSFSGNACTITVFV